MTDADLPTPQPEARRQRLSWVWLMPVFAVLVALGMIWQTYGNRGPLIVVSFPTATGIEVGQTPLRYRDLDVGTVESVGFSDGLAAIEVHIRLDKSIADYVDDDATFWLVRPQVSARGITGLSTVLSGVYIEGSWDGTPGASADRFTALDSAPLASPGEEGTRIVLRSRSGGQLVSGAPVLFNGIAVGWIGDPVLSESGLVVTRDAFIKAPYDERLTTASRFWDSSGLSLDIGTSGVSLNIDSLAALVEGGVTFGTMVTGGEPIEPGHIYTVFDGLRDARADALEGGGSRMSLAVLLDPAVAGLSTGTIVRYGPAQIGEVTAITGFRDPRTPDEAVRLLVDLEIVPERLGLVAGLSDDEKVAALEDRVESGLRLRVASEGILGQRTILEFAEMEDAPDAALETGVAPVPLVPSAPARRAERTAGVDGLVTRISNLPIEDLMTSAIDALDSVKELAASPETRDLPANANGLLADARALVDSDDLRAALADFQAATADLRGMTDEIRNSPGLASLLTALEASETIGSNITAFSDRLPGLADGVQSITAEIQAMPLADLTGSLDSLARQLESVLAAEGMDALPVTLRDTLGELQGVLSDLREGGAVDTLNQTLAAAESSLTAIEEATTQVPDLVERLDAVVATLQTAVGAYTPGSRFEVGLTSAIRDISAAADAFRSLARTIERNPNALITGR